MSDFVLNDTKYILIGHDVVPEPDLMVWAKWCEKASRRVGYTLLNRRRGIYVSTVFLGLDYSFSPGPPVVFETMIFGTSMDGYQNRYTTWRAAELGHAEAVGYARNARQLPAEKYRHYVKWRKKALLKLNLPLYP